MKKKNIKLLVAGIAIAIASGCSSQKGSQSESSMGSDVNGGLASDSMIETIDDGTGLDINGDAAQELSTVFLFEYDSSNLTPDAMADLDKHAQNLINTNQKVILEGHTDERGTREYNIALGERRGYVVKRYLVLQGVDAEKIEVVSYGEEKPRIDESNESAWAQNRRVELRD